MTDSRVAKRYARALFNAALKENIVASVHDDLAGIVATLQRSEDVRSFLKKPQTTDSQKEQLFTNTFSDKVTALTMSFVRLLIQKGRDEQLFQIQLEFESLRRQHERITKAVVTSSEPLDADQQKKVIEKIESKLGKKIEPEFAVDSKLMGGITVAYDDYVLDGSVKGKLERLREKLLYDLLKQA